MPAQVRHFRAAQRSKSRLRHLMIETLEHRRLLDGGGSGFTLQSIATSIQYTNGGSTYNENFDTLANAGTSSSLPNGFGFFETGSNSNTSYTANNGSLNSGDTYSYGEAGSTDRALGGLFSGSLQTILGARIQNKTGSVLSSMTVAYVGEQWRLGTSGRQDRLDFQYSLDATSLTVGTWVDVDALDFLAPITTGTVGELDGNLPANQSSRNATVNSLNLSNDGFLWFRWLDANVTGGDDGLAIDTFSFIGSTGGSSNNPPTITTPNDVTTAFQTPTPSIAFTVGDNETPVGSLTVTATSSNTLLVPNGNIGLSGTGANRNVILTPANGQSGTSTITLSVSDGSLTTNTTFQLTVQGPSNSNGHLRIVSYNISGASGDGTPRSDFGTLLAAMGTEIVNGLSRQVDLFAIQEVLTQATTSTIIANTLNNLYSTTAYATGLLNGATTGSGTQGVVYNSHTLQLLGEAAIGTASSTGMPRQAMRYFFRPLGTSGASDFYVYNSHFKASDDSDSASRRLDEAQTLRDDADALGQGAHVIYVGDFNLFRSSEAAYQELLSAGNGQAFDPVNRPGNWSNNSNFVDIFTQAPMMNAQNGLDGGGLDDRFDFQLNSGEFFNGTGLEYRTGTYHTFGNNGSVPVNGNINATSSTALPGMANRTTILNLLTTVSDHLPVVADYTFPVSATVVNRQLFYNRSTSTIFGDGTGNPTTSIDPTKLALLPGQSASFSNYSNVAKGINGLLVDIQGGTTSVNSSDFQFATSDGVVGSSFVPTSAVPTISVLAGQGLGGATRIKIEFADAAIRNTWLRITVLASSRTNLSSNDVFYFGSAVGDFNVGNIGSPISVRTNATDTSAVRQNQSPGTNSAPISNLYDVNKDGRVNASDTSLVRQNVQAAIIALFTAPTPLSLAMTAQATDWLLASEELVASTLLSEEFGFRRRVKASR
jgi:endonuclease/exonuclease/phosphatase family metal-dependent hydrolase